MEIKPSSTIFGLEHKLSSRVVGDVNGGGNGLVKNIVGLINLQADGNLGLGLWNDGDDDKKGQ